jgi:hypothetical protein
MSVTAKFPKSYRLRVFLFTLASTKSTKKHEGAEPLYKSQYALSERKKIPGNRLL